jgi:hypothetical protein
LLWWIWTDDNKYTSQACQITKDPFYWGDKLGTGWYCEFDCENLRECNNCKNGAKGSTTYLGPAEHSGCGSGCSLTNLIPNNQGVKWDTIGLKANNFRAGLHGYIF